MGKVEAGEGGPAPSGAEAGLVLRPLASADDYDACVEVQLATWGRQFAELVPGSILKICQKVGGVAAGAFDAEGSMLGFVFGLTGVDGKHPGRLVHWSHMLGVLPEARDSGVGKRLKLYQRELLLPLGIESVFWTYDPLEARNAHLNLNRLGAEVAEYVEEMYAGEMGSELAHGIGTDRFIVDWRIASPRVAAILAGEREDASRFRAAPVVNLPADLGGDPEGLPELPDLPRLRVEVPATIQALKARSPEEARHWRQGTRRAFETYLSRGYRVAAFEREPDSGRCFYGLERETHQEE